MAWRDPHTHRIVLDGALVPIVASVLALHLAGCGPNVYLLPDGPQTRRQARALLEELARSPRALERRLVLVSGWRSPPGGFGALAHWLDRCTTNATEMVSIAECPPDIPIPELARALFGGRGGPDPIDVVAYSMGGLVARVAARQGSVRIRTLFALATPNRGLPLARLMPWDVQMRDMHPGSEFIAGLDDTAPAPRDTICYSMRRDIIVPAGRAHIEGATHVVVSRAARRPLSAHRQILVDERVIYDIIRRLLSHDASPTGPSAPVASDTAR
ncbi:MAG: lipase family alpha/beta hydrolase [Planctomycetota bacterium]|jgi:pimeloyl-ACP methyl ester carboxylesterase